MDPLFHPFFIRKGSTSRRKSRRMDTTINGQEVAEADYEEGMIL